MKRFLIAIVVLAFTASTASAGYVGLGSNTFTMALSDLDDFILVANDAGSFSHTGDLTDGDADYSVTLSKPSGADSDNFTDIQIGFEFDKTKSGYAMAGYDDLNDYAKYTLGISNDNTGDGAEWIMANLFINTGWTDPGFHEDDVYVENTYTWLAPGTTTWLTLDVENTGYHRVLHWDGDSYEQTLEDTDGGDASLLWDPGHVTAIGINFGTNWNQSGTPWQPGNITASETYDLNAVPEPMSMVMLGCLGAGMIGARGLKRRNK